MHKAGGKTTTAERFDCAVLCVQKDEWVDSQREIHACSRADLTRVEWKPQAKRFRFGGWMGRLPILAPPGGRLCGEPINPKQPWEDPADGCPSGWSRSRFVESLYPFLRRRDAQGGRVANPMLDRCDDDTIIQLSMLFEHEQERWENYKLEALSDG